MSTSIRWLLLFVVALLDPQPATAQSQNAGAKTKLAEELKHYPHKILFESYVDNNWELFVMNADGSEIRNLTNTPTIHEMYPQASPDGTKIAFLVDVQKDGDTLRSVYYMNADGTGRVKVAERARQPCWSPDSKRIAFLKQEFKRFHVIDFASKGLFFHDLATGKIRQHPNKEIHHLYNPSWSPDGKWIVSTVHGGMGYKHGILAIPVDGMNVFNLRIGGCRPCISPDGTKLTWGKDDHTIAIGDLHLSESGCSVSNIISAAHDKKLHLYHADFSPDGKYLTFSQGPGGRVRANGPGTHTQVAEVVGVCGPWDLFLTRADDSNEHIQLTHDPKTANKESDWLPVWPTKQR